MQQYAQAVHRSPKLNYKYKAFLTGNKNYYMLQLYLQDTTKQYTTMYYWMLGQVAVLMAMRWLRDPSCCKGLICQLTSRPSLKHLVSWVLVLIHSGAV
jgi:hypothetical protein